MKDSIADQLYVITQQLARVVELLSAAAEKQPKTKPRKPFPEDFMPKPEHFAWAEEHGYRNPAWVHQQVEHMRAWALSKGELKADWDATLRTFMQKAANPPWQGAASTNNGAQPSQKLGNIFAKRV